MVTPYPDPGHWFWRGVQSAIFYYVSCAPCVEHRHKQRRRKEAREAQEIVVTQPGLTPRPVAFQTNEQWGEEMLLGPGPPKPYKPDTMLRRLREKLAVEPDPDSDIPPEDPKRPGMERRISTAMGNVKESIKLSVHPEKWNLKRYQREDEVFGNIGDKMTRMWDRVTNIGHHDDEAGPSSGRKRAYTNESDRYDYSRGRFPAVNDLHPPSVSQLPPTKEQAAWMLLPPPSAAVMAGKKRPNEDQGTRRPLCIIGRPPREENNRPTMNEEQRHASEASYVTDGTTEIGEESIRKHHRHQSEPLPFPPKAITLDAILPQSQPAELDNPHLPWVDIYKPKSRPSSWHFSYLVPSPAELSPSPPPVQ